MSVGLRILAVLLTLVGLGFASSPAALEARPGSEAQVMAEALPVAESCPQAMPAADDSSSELPHCPGAAMLSGAPCGVVLSPPADLRTGFVEDAAAEPIRPAERLLRDLLLATPFFRPPIV